MSANLSSSFEQFIQTISLGPKQRGRLDSVANALRTFLVESYGLPEHNFFVQGSYRNETIVEPTDGGEYDLDIAAVCVFDGSISGKEALEDLAERLASSDVYRDRIEPDPKRPCIRLRYSEDEVGKFHVDVIPLQFLGSTAPLKAPRPGAPWKETAPEEYTQWCAAQGEGFIRTVKILKRWRDENQTRRKAVKSIVLQVLIARELASASDDATRVTVTLRNLRDSLAGLARAPRVPNPVLVSEDLAESWNNEAFRDFVKELESAVDLSSAAASADTAVEAVEVWRELLGDDFPMVSTSELGLQLEDASHAATFSSRGWTEAPDNRYSVHVTAKYSSRRSNVPSLTMQSGKPVPAGRRLKFQAHVEGPPGPVLFWQVVNTGSDAAGHGDLRGDIFDGRDQYKTPKSGRLENWEESKYRGTHMIRALLVDGNSRVVATSNYFYVPVDKRR